MDDPLRVVFLAHAFPRTVDDVTGGFLLRLAAAPAASSTATASPAMSSRV